MKKFVLSLGLSCSLMAGAFAADNVLEQLNSEVASILAPIQNEATSAQLTFDTLETNTEHALKIALNAHYKKEGSQNTLAINLDNLSYNYGDGSAPKTALKGSVGLDFTKLLSQDEINQIIPVASEIIDLLAQDYTEAYGDAVTVQSDITSTSQDGAGNYTALTALLSVKFDFSQLPEDVSSDEIMFTGIVVSFGIDLKNGATLDAFVVSNPDYIGFQATQEGLKEVLDKLLARDAEIIEWIEERALSVDEFASNLVEMANSLRNFFNLKRA